MHMQKILLAAALLIAAPLVSAVPFLSMTIEDLNDATSETYFDAGTPGTIAVDGFTSALLGKYWEGSLQISVANNYEPSQPGEFISASINLNATDEIGENLVINILANGFENPINGAYPFSTIINAATVDDSSYSATVLVNGDALLTEIDIADTNTYAATDTFDIGSEYSITHAFRLNSNAPGADLGFDISTEAAPVPVPAPLALLGLGLVGMLGARRLVG